MSDIASSISSDILSDILSGKSSDRSSVIDSDMSSNILSDKSSDLSSDILSYKSCVIDSDLSSDILFDISSDTSSDISSHILADISSDVLPVVEVRHCPLRSEAPQLRSGAIHCDLALTVEVRRCWPLQLRSGDAHFHVRLARRKRTTRRKDMMTCIKSNNPHLTGGEKYSAKNLRDLCVLHFS